MILGCLRIASVIGKDGFIETVHDIRIAVGQFVHSADNGDILHDFIKIFLGQGPVGWQTGEERIS